MQEGTNSESRQAPKKRRFGKFLLISALIVVLGVIIAIFIAGLSYSDGTRSGILTKVSKKGYIFKTYEGEMNVGGISDGQGTIMPSTIFKFSVRNDSVYRRLEDLQGKRVRVRYKQVMKNLFWQGDTEYFVYEATAISQ